jgi:hypothetical protein
MRTSSALLTLIAIVLSLSLLTGIDGGAMAQPGKLIVSNSHMKKSVGYGEYLAADAYVENLTDQYAKNVTVKLIVNDPTGISGFSGTNQPRVYGTYTASIAEIAPHGAQWVNIPTTIANAQDINESRKTFLLELAGNNSEHTTTRAELQYFFQATAASFSE